MFALAFSYVENEEVYTISSLLKGLDEFDNAAVTRALSSPFISNLDNETTKVVRDLLAKYKPQEQNVNAAAGGAGGGGDNAHDDGGYDDEAGAVL